MVGDAGPEQPPRDHRVELAGVGPRAVHWSALVAAVPLFDVAWVWRVRPVLRYLVVMAVVVCVAYVLPPLPSGWIGGGGLELRDVFWSKTVFLLVVAGVAGLLVTGYRMTPTEAFLARGNMAAPSRVRLPGTSRPVSWAVWGTVAAAALFALMATVTWLQSGLEPAAFERLVPLLPLVIGCAAFNPLGEEVVYRSGPLATLVGVVGPGQGVLLTSVWFGLAQCFGSVPQGFGGVLQSASWHPPGSAMVATRELGWPVLVHFAVDLVVFASIAVVST